MAKGSIIWTEKDSSILKKYILLNKHSHTDKQYYLITLPSFPQTLCEDTHTHTNPKQTKKQKQKNKPRYL